jgi:hypothetical protein
MSRDQLSSRTQFKKPEKEGEIRRIRQLFLSRAPLPICGAKALQIAKQSAFKSFSSLSVILCNSNSLSLINTSFNLHFGSGVHELFAQIYQRMVNLLLLP